MAKRRHKRKPARTAPAHRQAGPVRVTPKAKSGTSVGTHLLTVATVLAGLGVLLTAYLTAIRWFGRHAAYCDAGSSCDAVQASRWSVLLGMPLSLWGFLMYALLIALLWRQRHRPSAWPKAITLAAFGTGMSIYLTAVSFFEIRATCIYCLASLAIITLIFALLAFLRPPNLQRFDWGDWALRTGPGVAVLLVVLHFHFSGLFDPAAGPEKPYLRGLAEHLSANDATFFGAYWCAQCQQQKTLFEASTHRLPYVECTPAGQGGPVAVDCVTNRIHSYPTWIIGGHRYERVLTPESLARLSGFKGPGSEPQ